MASWVGGSFATKKPFGSCEKTCRYYDRSINNSMTASPAGHELCDAVSQPNNRDTRSVWTWRIGDERGGDKGTRQGDETRGRKGTRQGDETRGRKGTRQGDERGRDKGTRQGDERGRDKGTRQGDERGRDKGTRQGDETRGRKGTKGDETH